MTVDSTLQLVLVLVAGRCFSIGQQPFVGCYYTNSSKYRQGLAKFLPTNIQNAPCNYLHYHYANIDVEHNCLLTVDDDNYNSVLDFKNKMYNLTVLLTVRDEGVPNCSWKFISDASRVAAFAENAVSFVRRYNFDGIDINWEADVDKDGYLRVIRALKSAIEKEKRRSGQQKLLLAASVSALSDQSVLFSPPLLADAADYIVVVAANFYLPSSNQLGHHSPLYCSDTQTANGCNSQDKAVRRWLEAGVPRNKLVLYVAAFGQAQKMQSDDLHNPGDPAVPTDGLTIRGESTKSTGAYAYFELCNKIKEGWTRVWMENSKVPYMFGREAAINQSVWISYDDRESLKAKANYVRDKKLRGIMLWSLDNDDFTGKVCGQNVYPLLNTIHDTILDFGGRNLPPAECTVGWYGSNCDQTCSDHCKDGMSCNKDTGECTQGCEDGWTNSPSCDRECIDPYCNETCSGQCNGGQLCDKKTGECTENCQAGWRNPPICDQECENGTFGANCSSMCQGHCKGEKPCDKVSGECTEGCAVGWVDSPVCQKLAEGTHFPLWAVIGGAAAVLFIAFVIIVSISYVSGFFFWKRCCPKKSITNTSQQTDTYVDPTSISNPHAVTPCTPSNAPQREPSGDYDLPHFYDSVHSAESPSVGFTCIQLPTGSRPRN